MCSGDKSHSGTALYVSYFCAILWCQFSLLSATPPVQPALSQQTSRHNGYIHPSSVTAYLHPGVLRPAPSSLGDKAELSPAMCLLCSKWNHRGTELHALLQVLLRPAHKQQKRQRNRNCRGRGCNVSLTRPKYRNITFSFNCSRDESF